MSRLGVGVAFVCSTCRVLACAVISLGVSEYLFFSSFRKEKRHFSLR